MEASFFRINGIAGKRERERERKKFARRVSEIRLSTAGKKSELEFAACASSMTASKATDMKAAIGRRHTHTYVHSPYTAARKFCLRVLPIYPYRRIFELFQNRMSNSASKSMLSCWRSPIRLILLMKRFTAKLATYFIRHHCQHKITYIIYQKSPWMRFEPVSLLLITRMYYRWAYKISHIYILFSYIHLSMWLMKHFSDESCF